jgi:Golgi SNAP receptor complex protein 2
MSSDFHDGIALLNNASRMVESLERGNSGDPDGVAQVANEARDKLKAALAGARGNVAQQRRIEQALIDVDHIQNDVERCRAKLARHQHTRRQREELLANAKPRDSNIADLDHLNLEGKSLLYTRQKVRQMVEENGALLSALRGQGERIKGGQSKLGELLQSLGASNQTILQIVRTNRVDAWIVYGGIFLLFLLMGYLWLR